jgi:carbonic anhydrase/acetyltransferase-like protein (isoleucine patch superfamily)
MLKNLEDELKEMHEKHRLQIKSQFNRINPLMEDVVDWKQKGKFAFNDESITVYDSATIIGDVKVGSNTWIGPFTILDGSGGLNIGKYCSISAGVKIMTHDTVKWALSLGEENYEYGPIKIGD